MKVPEAPVGADCAPQPPLTAPRPPHDDDDDGLLSSSSSSAGPPDLVDELAALGFDCAGAFCARHPHGRVRQALARVRSLRGIRNPPGLLRYLVEKPGPIPDPAGVQPGPGGLISRGPTARRVGL